MADTDNTDNVNGTHNADDAIWLIKKNQIILGPFTEQEIKHKLATGVIAYSDMASIPGQLFWGVLVGYPEFYISEVYDMKHLAQTKTTEIAIPDTTTADTDITTTNTAAVTTDTDITTTNTVATADTDITTTNNTAATADTDITTTTNTAATTTDTDITTTANTAATADTDVNIVVDTNTTVQKQPITNITAKTVAKLISKSKIVFKSFTQQIINNKFYFLYFFTLLIIVTVVIVEKPFILNSIKDILNSIYYYLVF